MPRFRVAAYKPPGICYSYAAPNPSTGAGEVRHGQGSDAQQQGKEETEGGQEPQKGRPRAVAVRIRQERGRPEPVQKVTSLRRTIVRLQEKCLDARPRGRCALVQTQRKATLGCFS